MATISIPTVTKTFTPGTVTTMVAQPQFRWHRRLPHEIPGVLQQAWMVMETGEVVWEDVPTIVEP